MAGGKGSRLHPYSALFPKPLMPLGDKPVLEILLHQLRAAGVTEVILAVNHLRHLLEAFFGDGSRFGLSITYSVEDRPLGTAGPIGLVLDRLGEDFFLTNGDLLTTLDMGAMLADHRARRADATIGTYRRELRSEFGLAGGGRDDAHDWLQGETDLSASRQHGHLRAAAGRGAAVRRARGAVGHAGADAGDAASGPAACSATARIASGWTSAGRRISRKRRRSSNVIRKPSVRTPVTMRLLLTGATGFLGRHIVAAATDWTVTRFTRAPVCSAADELALGPAPWTRADFSRALEIGRPDVVIHCAGAIQSSDVRACFDTNTVLAAELLGAAVAASRPPRVILVGSAAEYGIVPADAQPVAETYPCAPLTDYAIAKYAQSLLGFAAAKRVSRFWSRGCSTRWVSVCRPISHCLPLLGRLLDQSSIPSCGWATLPQHGTSWT